MDFREIPYLDPATVPATAEELVALVQDQVEWITGCLTQPNDSWTPSLFVRCRMMEGKPEVGDILHALHVPFNTDAEKRFVMMDLGRKLFTQGSLPAAAVLTSEAWQSVRAADAPHIQPKDDPARTEGIIIMASSLGGKRSAYSHIPITRGAKNVIIPGTPRETITDGVRSPLLDHLWRGFFEQVKAGRM